ncbi:hypothetical protein Pmar_PMAR001208 [Perkinsus marinus ATCC 50983]|uniref:N-acetyltransferase domain-containing protein n=1 Tax=Perkinsus marinus (strain ATCC 50983 / TXsc) TaxID=423536 RepID=C5KT60_PERM5|nr:hypothetical protein Pmar_PMAR001208 [Perkinsus marinus ATCC 50983]EER12410.1 hypothetical protein Pmar_PMAR001208 [Perkinsus marinus ATCC 50983]|eukprot:XP_002780615.1 hypothetical protein Pmar_PMAR001208 [Perkinsus marinus ATCC 50983]
MPFFRCFILLLGVLAAGGVTIRDYQPGDNMDSEDLKSYCEVFECLVAVDAPTSKAPKKRRRPGLRRLVCQLVVPECSHASLPLQKADVVKASVREKPKVVAVYLHVEAKKKEAIKLYEKLGFEKVLDRGYGFVYAYYI